MTLQTQRGSPSISARSGFILRGSPSTSARMGFHLKRIALKIKPRTNRNGSLNTPRSCSGHHDPSRGSPSISARWGFNLRGSPSNSAHLGFKSKRISLASRLVWTSNGRNSREKQPPSSFDAPKKQQNLSPLGSSLTQNAPIASNKHLEPLPYLEFSQNTAKRLCGPRTEAPWSICVGSHTFPSLCLSTMGTLYPIVFSVENSTRSVR
jgi:hypothetical protein